MKTLINITAIRYNGNTCIGEKQYSFIRPNSRRNPTTIGAERMIQRQLADQGIPAKLSDICIQRVETMSCDCK